jgi:hypothetical protein
MTKNNKLIAAIAVVVLAASGPVGVVPGSVALAAGACDTLEAQFKKSVRPKILRLAKKNFHWSNWYQATLKRHQGGAKHPSPAALKATHAQMIEYCGTDKKCKTFATDMNAASKAIYDVNKRWKDAGCPGQLDS